MPHSTRTAGGLDFEAAFSLENSALLRIAQFEKRIPFPERKPVITFHATSHILSGEAEKRRFFLYSAENPCLRNFSHLVHKRIFPVPYPHERGISAFSAGFHAFFGDNSVSLGYCEKPKFVL